jgi:hypothetical protein
MDETKKERHRMHRAGLRRMEKRAQIQAVLFMGACLMLYFGVVVLAILLDRNRW